MKKLLSKVKHPLGHRSKHSSPDRSSVGSSASAPVSKVDITKFHKETGWNILKRVLAVARDGSDLCLPLKAALVGVVAAMEEVEVSRVITATVSPSNACFE